MNISVPTDTVYFANDNFVKTWSKKKPDCHLIKIFKTDKNNFFITFNKGQVILKNIQISILIFIVFIIIFWVCPFAFTKC